MDLPLLILKKPENEAISIPHMDSKCMCMYEHTAYLFVGNSLTTVGYLLQVFIVRFLTSALS